MPTRNVSGDAAFREFLRRVWTEDIRPLLDDRRAAQRRSTARTGAKYAGATGAFLDGVFNLRGKPFARMFTVWGGSFGALLPDAWDWKWLRDDATESQREAVRERIEQRAATLPETDALALFGLTPAATRDDLKVAWREFLLHGHPDKAPTPAQRDEYTIRFLTCKSAFELLCRAYDEQRLPKSP
jgi:hypothetical protein